MKRGKNWLVCCMAIFIHADIPGTGLHQAQLVFWKLINIGIFFNKSDDEPNQVDNSGNTLRGCRISSSYRPNFWGSTFLYGW
jgi:hypothetical protein